MALGILHLVCATVAGAALIAAHNVQAVVWVGISVLWTGVALMWVYVAVVGERQTLEAVQAADDALHLLDRIRRAGLN